MNSIHPGAIKYTYLYLLLFIVAFTGLFVPLMDNDAAHHANIALRMYLTGDFITLADQNGDYLDKPHLHFWLSALSYKVFGVNGFAYKFPSLLFGILAVYSTYRLASVLYDRSVGKLAALIVATSFAFLLSLTDVRMDALLTSCIVFTTWMGVVWVNKKNLKTIIAMALGAALGFSTKGHIALLVPAISIFIYILQQRQFKSFYHWHLLVFGVSFFIFISPVLYSYYIQFDLNPDKVIRGEKGRSGIAFILWNQNMERIAGDKFGSDSSGDRLFFFHTFLWAFAPWSILAYIAIYKRLANFRKNSTEWVTTGTILLFALLISFAGFKLPHYLNIIMPLAAILVAASLYQQKVKPGLKHLLTLQYITCLLALALVLIINFWAFPIQNFWIITGLLVLTGVSYLMIVKKDTFSKLVHITATTVIIIFYLLNINFYPALLGYQAGNKLAQTTSGTIPPENVYYWPGVYSSSYDFYSSELRKPYDSTTILPTPAWIMIAKNQLPALYETGFKMLDAVRKPDFEITRLDFRFINPQTRRDKLDTLMLVRIK